MYWFILSWTPPLSAIASVARSLVAGTGPQASTHSPSHERSKAATERQTGGPIAPPSPTAICARYSKPPIVVAEQSRTVQTVLCPLDCGPDRGPAGDALLIAAHIVNSIEQLHPDYAAWFRDDAMQQDLHANSQPEGGAVEE